ncbi:MAG: diaminopimelate decarboxylase, partial [Spirochaetales bacterium]|nr:diaminopimelate decarboxylase [Spirochaetales bacterium]
MTEKKLPFNKEQIDEIIKKYPTPFHIYDERAIVENVQKFIKAFSWIEGFKEYYAVKACPNPSILKLLREQGCGTDCSSLPELVLSERAGIVGENIMFSSNETPLKEYVKAKEIGAIINIDDITHIDFIHNNIGLPELVSFRYNPGPERTGNAIIGNPVEAKYGLTKEQLFTGYKMLQERGVKRFGLHTMVASNELNPDFFVETARSLFQLARDIHQKLGIKLEFVNMSGGFGIPYKPEQNALDIDYISGKIKALYDEMIVPAGLHPLKLFTECGRLITGPYGYLVTTAIHKKDIYKNYIGLDACMANLMRPALYGAYHHITVMGKENAPADHKYDIVGSLCENNDKFAIDRMLPKIDIGDTVVIHDAGAHGYSMGFNYNGKLRSAELLLHTDGSVEMIRRAETMDDYFATL